MHFHEFFQSGAVWRALKSFRTNYPMHTLVSRRKLHLLRLRFATGFLVASLIPTAGAQTNPLPSAAEFKKLTLEELMNLEVTIVTRGEGKFAAAPSALQVVTGEDIQRSGATSIPEALRLAPNLHVAQLNASQWAITARGFNNTLANKLLVMIDGRTVYTPLFAGVFWDVQNTFLPDVDRIEVVSGPGASLWGANAVNGVINIVSRHSKHTQGLLVEGAAGTFLQNYAAIRYGGSPGSNVFFRVYGQRFDRNETLLPNGRGGGTDWDMTQGGFRMDWNPSEADIVTFQGDVYSGHVNRPTLTENITVDGQNLLGRWSRTLHDQSDIIIQTYFDRTWRHIPGTGSEDLKTYDIDFQHRFPLGARNTVTWGAGYRLMQDDVTSGAALAVIPEDRNMQLFSGFLQDAIALIPDRLTLILGSKLEHNDFSGFEIQPSARIAWTPDPRHTIWAAVSRAVRSPTRIDREFFSPPNPPHVLAGGENFDSEKVLAYELGYRAHPSDRLLVSVATFYNDYDDLRSQEMTPSGLVFKNGLEGESWGVELAAEFAAAEWWRLRGGYTYFEKELWEKPGHTDVIGTINVRNDPKHQVLLQSTMNLPHNVSLDWVARYVSRLPMPEVPDYFTFDVRLAWRPKPNLELSIVGQNLWDDQHPEFGPRSTRQEIPRSVYGKVAWHF
jgi:iron complex outermembrane recepter protein